LTSQSFPLIHPVCRSTCAYRLAGFRSRELPFRVGPYLSPTALTPSSCLAKLKLFGLLRCAGYPCISALQCAESIAFRSVVGDRFRSSEPQLAPRRVSRFFQVRKPFGLPRRTDHPIYFGLVNVIAQAVCEPGTNLLLAGGCGPGASTHLSIPVYRIRS